MAATAARLASQGRRLRRRTADVPRPACRRAPYRRPAACRAGPRARGTSAAVSVGMPQVDGPSARTPNVQATHAWDEYTGGDGVRYRFPCLRIEARENIEQGARHRLRVPRLRARRPPPLRAAPARRPCCPWPGERPRSHDHLPHPTPRCLPCQGSRLPPQAALRLQARSCCWTTAARTGCRRRTPTPTPSSLRLPPARRAAAELPEAESRRRASRC